MDEVQASELGERDIPDIIEHPSILEKRDVLKQAGQAAFLKLTS